LLAGLGTVGALTAHGFTDQVVTTNVGTALLLLGCATVVAALPPMALMALVRLVARVGVGLTALAAVVAVGFAATPAGRAQVLLDLGGLRLNQALALEPLAAGRAAGLADAESTLAFGLAQDAGHPGVLRQLARARSARFDDAGALDAVQRAATSPRMDTFDQLQIAHLYRDLGFADEAYTLAARAYAAWGRPPEDVVMRAYAQATLSDSRARTLADQAEAAMRARSFGEAKSLFEQARTFEPANAYLQDRLAAAQRAVDKYGG
jgi:hypothetical protein